jgi:mono/diheme cytochrome c family protein
MPMQRRTFFLFLILAGIVQACAYEKKLGIDMPEGFTADKKKVLMEQFAAGKKAYLTHCASCHNKTINDKSVIPDISFEQAETYKVRFSNNNHKTALKEETITEAELDAIVIFFKYKKASGVAPF